MHKKAILACMLIVTMLLTGCALIEKDETVDLAREVIRVTNAAGGEDIVYTKGQVLNQVAYQLNYNAYLYSMLGYSYDPNDPNMIAQTKDEAMKGLVQDAVLTLKAQELGLDQFTEEELAEISTKVDQNLESVKSSIQAQEFADTELTGEELDAALEARMAEEGYTREMYEESARHTMLLDKLREHVIQDVAINEDELKAGFDEKVASQQSTYDATPSSYVTARNNGTTVYYAPAGVRMVKQILLKFGAEDQALIDDLKAEITTKTTAVNSLTKSLNDALGADAAVTVDELLAQVQVTLENPPAAEPVPAAEGEAVLATATDLPVSSIATVTDLTADITAEVSDEVKELVKELATAKAELTFYQDQLTVAQENGWNHLDAKAQEVLAQLKDGADFDAMMDQYNEDPGMKADSTARKNGGYAVCEGYTSFDSDFMAAAMSLTEVGAMTDQVRTQFGTHILLYASDVEQGPVALEDVREELTASLLSTKQNETYDAQKEAWVGEAKVKTHRNLLDD